MDTSSARGSFWEHLDVLRGVLLRIIVVAFLFGIVAFIFKDALFAFVLAPKSADFVTYRLIGRMCEALGVEAPAAFHVQLINTGLAQQFMIHVKTAFCVGVLCASPYIVYQLFAFVAPGLYARERHYAITVATGGYVMFVIGVAVSYLIIFPLTFRFLGTYQVAGDVVNMIDIESYISTLLVMSLCMGVVFEIPVLSYLLALTGLLDAQFMCRYRRHAIVVILVAAAVITPTSDVFTLMIVSLPMWLLYEASIRIVRNVGLKHGEGTLDRCLDADGRVGVEDAT